MALEQNPLYQKLKKQIGIPAVAKTLPASTAEMMRPYRDIRQRFLEPEEAIRGVPFAEPFEKDPITTEYPFVGERPSLDASFTALPTRIGGGSYVTDPNDLNEVYKSERMDWGSQSSKLLRGGMSGTFYEIDHIIPIWAGGINDLSNIQTLFHTDHEKKTKVGSIARELYYNDKIGLGEARSLVANWRDKAVDDISLGDKGEVPLAAAEAKFKEWQTIPKVGFKEWWQAFKEGPKGALGEFAQAATAGVTGGWVPAGQREYEEAEQTKIKTARIAGSTIGTIAGFVTLGAIARGIGAVKGLSKVLSQTKVAQRLKPGAKIGIGGITVSTGKLSAIVRNVGLFNLYGQLSKHQENTFKERMESIFVDTAMGASLGIAPKGLKGIPAVSLPAFSLSYITGSDFEDAFVHGAVMAGLHSIGGIGQKKKMQTMLDVESTKAAYNFRNTWLDGSAKAGKPIIKDNKLVGFERTNAKTIEMENKTISAKMIKDFERGDLTADKIISEKQKLIVSARTLYKQQLPKVARLREEVSDYLSTSKKIQEEGKTGIRSEVAGFPRGVVGFADKNPEFFGGAPRKEKLDIKSVEKNRTIEGEFETTGVASEIDPKTQANVRLISDAVNNGRTDKKVILVAQPELKYFIKEINKTLDPAEVKSNLKAEYKSPEKNVAVIKYYNGENKSLGMVPRELRVEGFETSFNKRIREEKRPLRRPYDPNINKNTIYDKMKENNTSAIIGEIDWIGKGVLTKQFTSRIKLTHPLWEESIARNKGVKSIFDTEAERITQAINFVKQPVSDKPHDILLKLDVVGPSDTLNRRVVDARFTVADKFFKDVDKQLTKGTAQSFKEEINSKLGEILNDKQAKDLFDKRTEITFEKVTELLDQSAKKSLKEGTPQSEYVCAFNNLIKKDYEFQKSWAGMKDQIFIGAKEAERIKVPIVKPKVVEPAEVKPPVVERPSVVEPPAKLPTPPIEKGLPTITTKARAPEGTFWREQNVDKPTDFGKFAKEGHDVKWLMDKKGFAGPVIIDGIEYKSNVEARKAVIDPWRRGEITPTKEVAPPEADIVVEEKVQEIKEGLDRDKVYTERPEIVDDSSKVQKLSPREESVDMLHSEVLHDVSAKELTKASAWGNYSNKKILKGIDNYTIDQIIKLQDKGERTKALELEKITNDLFTREKLMIKAEGLMEKYKGNTDKAFDEFKKDTSDFIRRNTDFADPFTKNNFNKVFKHHFLRLANHQRAYQVAFGHEGKKFNVSETESSVSSGGDIKIGHYKKDNNLSKDALQVISIDTKNSIDLKKVPTAKKYDFTVKQLLENGYFPLGTKANGLGKLLAVKKEPSLIKKFDSKLKIDPEYYKLNLDKKPLSDFNDNDKFLRVFLTDVLGMPKSIDTGISKRWNLIFNRELVNTASKKNYRHIYVESPSIKELETRYGQKIYNEALIPEKTLGTDTWINKKKRPALDGKIWISPTLAKEWSIGNAFIKTKGHFKPGVYHTYKEKGLNKAIIMKGDIEVWNDNVKNFFKEHYGLREFGDRDIISTMEEVKIGRDALKPLRDDINGRPIMTAEIPSDAYRLKHLESETATMKFSPSYLGKLNHADGLNNVIKELYSKDVDIYKQFKSDINAGKGGEDLIKVFENYFDHYSINFKDNLYNHYKVMAELGAGPRKLGRAVERIIDNIWQEKVIRLNHVPSAYMYATPDLGYIKNGKRVFLKDNEVMMNQKNFDKLKLTKEEDTVLSLRNPSTKKTALSKIKVLIGEKHGVKLNDEQVILNYHDGYLRKEFDMDGDTLGFWKIGTGGIPEKMANRFEEIRMKDKDIVLPELDKYEKDTPTFENLNNITRIQLLGEQGVNMAAVTNRIMPTLVDNKVKMKIDPKYSKVGIKKPVELEFKWDKETENFVTYIWQISVDSINTKNLSKLKNFDETYINRRIVKPVSGSKEDIAKMFEEGVLVDDGALKTVEFTIGGKRGAGKTPGVRPFKNYQEPFTIAKRENKLPGNKWLHDRLDQINKKVDGIEATGGEKSPIQEVFSQFKGDKPFEVIDNNSKLSVKYDTAGGRVVKDVFGKELEPKLLNPKVQEFIKIAEDARKKYAQPGPYTERKPFRDAVVDYYLKNKHTYDKDINDTIVYWTITEPGGNISWGPQYKSPLYVWRYDEIITTSPRLARTYYEAYEIAPEGSALSNMPPIASNVIEKEGILSKNKNRLVAAQYDRKTDTINIDSKKVNKDFKEKAWTKPKVLGVRPLSKNAFKNEIGYRKFVIEHEKAHARSPQKKGESIADYENRMNLEALRTMGKRFSIGKK